MGEWKSLKTDAGTGWKALYREAGIGWKALEWDSVPIDVGGACIDRPADSHLVAYTHIDLNNPANTGGTLTNICTYVYLTGSTDWYVGVFYLVSGTTYKCRSAANMGTQSVGSNNNAVSLTVVAGDYIGVYAITSEKIERTNSGNGYMYANGNKCVVDDESSYALTTNATLSLYGTG